MVEFDSNGNPIEQAQDAAQQAPPPQYQAPQQPYQAPYGGAPYGAPAKLPGTTLLKVVGIIMIVFSAIAVIISLLGLVGGGVLATVAASIGAIVLVASLVTLIVSVLELFFGIQAVRYCNIKEKAGTLFTYGIIMIIIAIASMVLSAVMNAMIAGAYGAGTGVGTNLIGLVLPILYLVGASNNKKAV